MNLMKVIRSEILVLTCVLLALLAALSVGLDARAKAEHDRAAFQRLSSYLYNRCLIREAYDKAGDTAREAMVAQQDATIAQERTNKFVDDTLRAKRIGSATATRDALQHAIDLEPVSGCSHYRP